MFGKQMPAAGRARDEGEKPFWISFADLMTAMMILFLVVMVASLSSVTQRIKQAEQGEKQRTQDIGRLCERLQLTAKNSNNQSRWTAKTTASVLARRDGSAITSTRSVTKARALCNQSYQ